MTAKDSEKKREIMKDSNKKQQKKLDEFVILDEGIPARGLWPA